MKGHDRGRRKGKFRILRSGLAGTGETPEILFAYRLHLSVDRMQRNFEPMRRQVETSQISELFLRRYD
jgi:hypothetical protein